MKRLRMIMAIGLSASSVAVAIAVWFLVSLYSHEKGKTMEIVRDCARNADILEIVGRMESSDKAEQTFIRLNSYIEFAQQKEGKIADSDTLQTSLGALLRFGLEFPEGKSGTDYHTLDSIFLAELHRHGLYPSFASILPAGSEKPQKASLWKTQYGVATYRNSPEFDVYVSPLPGRVLSRMWGIIIPFCLIIGIFTFLAIYLLRVIRQMRTLESMKDDFTHNMTHELKTPVAVAYSAADSMLRYYDQSDEQRNKKFLSIIMQRLNFLSGMIENILSMSMERFKTVQLNIEKIRLKPIVEEVAGMIEMKADKPVKVEDNITDDVEISTDSLHFGNVISNLLDNSVKYSPDAVQIKISGNNHAISIADNGIGIPKENQPYIFDKFYRVTVGDRYEVGGYGLGLYYVKQIVEMQGWSISVISEQNKGTTFIIKFKSDDEKR